MKKKILFGITLSVLTTCCAFGAKYTVNSSGTVRNQSNQVITSPANSTNQNYNYYNNFYASNYINQNQVNQVPVDIIEFVMDYSGSMANWIEVAKMSMSAIIMQVPTSAQIGFRVFGHDQYGRNPSFSSNVRQVKEIVKGKNNKIKVVAENNGLGSTSGICSATEQVAPITFANSANILSGMNSVFSGGATPLVYALDRTVYQDFSKFDQSSPKKIVLITDGGENCGGDPCQFAQRLMAKRSDIHIDVVLVSSSSRSLACLSNATGGHFYNINNLSDFSTTITNSLNSEPSNSPTNNSIQKQNYEFVND